MQMQTGCAAWPTRLLSINRTCIAEQTAGTRHTLPPSTLHTGSAPAGPTEQIKHLQFHTYWMPAKTLLVVDVTEMAIKV